MAAQATQSIIRTGITPTYAAANAGGDTFTPGARTFLHVKNTNAATRDITVVSSSTTIGLAVADVTVTIPATTGDKIIGPFPYEHFADATGQAAVTWSSATNVTIAVLDLSAP